MILEYLMSVNNMQLYNQTLRWPIMQQEQFAAFLKPSGHTTQ